MFMREWVAVLCLCILGMFAVGSSAMADECPALFVDGVQAIPRDIDTGTCQWCSYPGSLPLSAVTSSGLCWNGKNGVNASCIGNPCGDNSLHWVLTSSGFLTISNRCGIPPTPPPPTATPTPPRTPTPTPTPPDCRPNLCNLQQCGYLPDGCGGTVWCGECPPPFPPTPTPTATRTWPPGPGRTPTPYIPEKVCAICEWDGWVQFHESEVVTFLDPTIIDTIILDPDESNLTTYVIWYGDYQHPDNAKKLFTFMTECPVTIPFKRAGLGAAYRHNLWFTGGFGTMTIFTDKPVGVHAR